MRMSDVGDNAENTYAAAAFALNAMTPEEREAFLQQADDDPDLWSEVTEFRKVTEAMSLYLLEDPPAGVKDTVMSLISTVPQVDRITPAPRVGAQDLAPVASLSERRAIRRGSLAALTAMAAAILVIVGFVALDTPTSTVDDQIAAALANPAATVEVLENDTGMLRIITLPESQDAMLVGSGLPALGVEQTYQLWAIDGAVEGAAPVSAGIFDLSNGEIRAVLRRTDVADPLWAVSIEPAGGSAQPTGEIVLISA